MGSPTRQRLIDLCRDVLRPLIEADEGQLFLLSATEKALSLHLGGNCSGCPGAPITIRTLIEPAVRAVDPDVQVVVSVGASRPQMASRVTPSGPEPALEGSSLDEDNAPDTEVGEMDGWTATLEVELGASSIHEDGDADGDADGDGGGDGDGDAHPVAEAGGDGGPVADRT